MQFLVVPNALSAEINRRIDAALVEHPEAAPGRELFYQELLGAFNDLGYIPEFTLSRNA